MKTLSLSLLVVTLIASLGCGSDANDPVQTNRPDATPETTAPESRVTTAKPELKEAQETEATEPGEADNTFSLTVPFEAVTLTQGKEVPVRIGIERGENFGQEVALEVTGLPAGVTVETEESVIAHGSMRVTLTFKATADAALGDFTAKVNGSTESSSADFSEEIELTVAPSAETTSNNE
ncbi:MAG: hypothetical protein WEE51_11740 [Pirellulaceae bacterium]